MMTKERVRVPDVLEGRALRMWHLSMQLWALRLRVGC